MTIGSTWSVQIGTKGSFTEFVSRTLGFTTRTRLSRGQMGNGNAVITLDNNDGALTPNAGGTYSGVDWFSQAVLIECTVTDGTNSETVPVFHGGLETFVVNDDGVNSTVTIEVRDIMTIVGRAPIYDYPASINLEGPRPATLRALNGGGPSSIPGIATPKYGATATQFQYSTYPTSSSTSYGIAATDMYYTIQHADRPSGEIINTQIMPSGPHYAWPTIFYFSAGAIDLYFMLALATSALNRLTTLSPPDTNKSNARPQTFVANPTGTQLPRNTVTAGWNIDDVRNSAEMAYWNDATVYTADNTTSSDKYGVSNVTVLQSAIQGNTTGELTRSVNRWAKQYDQPSYAAQQLTVRESTVIDKCDNAAYESWADLLDIRSGLWNVAAVTYTPTGAVTPVTDSTVIFGRTIRVTPSDTVVTLDLVPAANYQYFELDNTALGVLDQNRLG